MPKSNCVIVGCDDQSDNELVVAYVRSPENGDNRPLSWFAWIQNAQNGPQIVVRQERSEILVTESLHGGGRAYTLLSRYSDGQRLFWGYTTGTVISIEAGWLECGSSSSRGKVVFDSSNILDRALTSINERNLR